MISPVGCKSFRRLFKSDAKFFNILLFNKIVFPISTSNPRRDLGFSLKFSCHLSNLHAKKVVVPTSRKFLKVKFFICVNKMSKPKTEMNDVSGGGIKW